MRLGFTGSVVTTEVVRVRCIILVADEGIAKCGVTIVADFFVLQHRAVSFGSTERIHAG